MNGARCVIRPEMTCTSRDRRSSLATHTAAFALRAWSSAALELWATLERIGTLARLNLDQLTDDLAAFGQGEALNCITRSAGSATPLGTIRKIIGCCLKSDEAVRQH